MRFKGEKTELVTLKKRDVTYVKNEPQEDWDDNDESIYAEFWEKHGKEGDTDGQILVMQDVRCKVRYKETFDKREGNNPEADTRIVRSGIIYDVESVIPIGRREGFYLMLKYRDNI